MVNNTTQIKYLLEQVEDYCQQHNLRFTAPRKQVLEIIASSSSPLGAYEILDRYARQLSTRAQPPTIYRALSFLEEQGLIHRIASLNAYVLCTYDGQHHHHGSQFMICDKCHTVREMHVPALMDMIDTQTKTAKFEAGELTVEVHGVCEDCAALKSKVLT